MGLQLLYGAALLGASVQAFAFLPQPTDPFQAAPLENGWTPRPTPAPEGHGLFKRQISLPSSYLIAPDNTCGFINGNSRSAYACLDDDMQCAFIPSSGKIPGAAGCCKGKDCSFRISCIERSDMDDCDDDCKENPLTLKCSGLARFCNTVLFPGGVTDYYCSARRQTSALEAETTNNRDKSRSMSTVAPKTTSTTKKSTSTTTTKKSSTTSTSESSSTEATSETTSETTAEVTSEEPAATTEPPTAATTVDSDRSSATTSSTEPVSSDSPSTPIGAIVGGILGGIALIAVVIFAVIFLRQHKKKNGAMAELPPPQPFMAEPTYPNTQPPAAPYGQDSASARMSGYAASSAAATPAHMYGAPVAAGAGAGAAAAAAAAGSFNSYHNHHPNNQTSNYPAHHASPNPNNTNNYQDYQDYHHHAASIASTTYPDHPYSNSNNHNNQPSPMTTPGGSPQPQYAHTPHAPPPLPAPSYYNNSPRQSQDTYRGTSSHGPGGGMGGGGAGGGMGGMGGGGAGLGVSDGAWAGAEPVELPDRRSTSTPVSTYNGVMPVSPASALGPMPGESHGNGSGGGLGGSGSGNGSGMGGGSGNSGVPLILQPGMGYRPYRPPGGGAGGGAGGAGGNAGAGAGMGMGAGAGIGAGAMVGTAIVGSAVAVNVVTVNRNGSVRVNGSGNKNGNGGMVVPRKAVGGGGGSGSGLSPVVQGQVAQVQGQAQGQQAQEQAPDQRGQAQGSGGGGHQQTFAVELP